MDLGNRIAKLRKSKNLTQEALAEKLFVTDKTVSSWESNRTEPSLDTIVRLSKVLECSASYLIYGDADRSDIETEIKIKLTEEEFKKINKLMKENATFLNESSQLDTYYQPVHRKFLKDNEENVEEWLRIGLRGGKKILNYKKWYDNMYCDEYEVEIDDEVNLDRILKIIGLEEIVKVDKKRITYFYLDKYEVALDYVEELGHFIEIEVKKYEKKAIEEYDDLLVLATSLGINLDNIDKRGYPYHLIYNKLKN